MTEYPGAICTEAGARFVVWAPRAGAVELHLHGTKGGDRFLAMDAGDHGYFRLDVADAGVGSRYTFRIDGDGEFPDPSSSFQPEGVHAASEVVDHRLWPWSDGDFVPASIDCLVLYELHIGTFTPEGSFDSAAKRLAELSALGVTAVEVMPIAQFPGERNWGYDGVYPFAVQASYGGPEGFHRFVNAAHAAGVAVILDVVYNHFGPEGNYSAQFGDYFTDRYRTPWGSAVNVDGPGSEEVRRFFAANLLHWMERYHVDGFRLDAIHEIHDESALPFLAELSRVVDDYSQQSGKRHLIIAESDLNDRRIVVPPANHGVGMDAAWADDFHHAVHARLTGERKGYFGDFGDLGHIARALEMGWSYSGEYSAHRRRPHGNSPLGLPASSFVFCTQNHDQVGNRMLGERLAAIRGLEGERVGRALLLLAPYVPLLFMGQEYGETRPFLYFVDHGDEDLLEATREGRKREFAAFQDSGEPPDPGAAETRGRSVLDWQGRRNGEHAVDLELTRRLLALRSTYDCFRPGSGRTPLRRCRVVGECVILVSQGLKHTGIVAANFGDGLQAVSLGGLAPATENGPEMPGLARAFGANMGGPETPQSDGRVAGEDGGPWRAREVFSLRDADGPEEPVGSIEIRGLDVRAFVRI